MKLGMVNKLIIVNRFILHFLYCNITHLAAKTLETNLKIDNLKREEWRRAFVSVILLLKTITNIKSLKKIWKLALVHFPHPHLKIIRVVIMQ